MIHDIEQFTKVLKELLEYYGKPANETAISVWFSVCSESLTDEEFLQAVTLCMRQRDRIPAIDEFVGLLKGDPNALENIALQDAWKSILEAAAIANSRDKDHTAFRLKVKESLTPAQSYALTQLGNFTGLGELSSEDLVWRQKRFVQLCKSYEQGQKQLRLAGGESSDPVDIRCLISEQNTSITKSKGFSSLGDALL